jgi:ABC-type sugar transport system ATPase subunit
VFVARFIGSPAMNVVPARLVTEGATSLELADGSRWPVADDWSGRPHSVRDVVVGVRPDALTTPAPPDWPRFTTTVVAAEFLGNAQHVLFAAPGGATGDPGDVWTARLDADREVAPGARLTLSVDTSEIHLFDAVSGTALARHPRRRLADLGTRACTLVA